MARSTVEVELLAEVTKARKAVDDFSKNTQKQLDGISFNSAVTAINQGFELISKTAGRAFSSISGVISDAVSEAADAEQSITQLANALRLTNDFSEEAIEDFKDLAEEIQSVSTFTDDAVLSSLALAKQFRATNKEAKQVVSVAADLAAITGTSLDDATRSVAQTLNGFVDRGLAKAIPELKNLSKEALIAGDAIAVIRNRVQGSAEALAGTFSGAVIQSRNSFSDLLETIGGFIVENPVIVQGIKLIGQTFRDLNKVVLENKDAISGVIKDGFIFLIDSIPVVLSGINGLIRGFSSLAFIGEKLGIIFGGTAAALTSFLSGEKGVGQDIFQQIGQDLDDLEVRYGNFLNGTDAAYNKLLDSANRLSDSVKNVSEGAKTSFENAGASLSGAGNRSKDLDDLQKSADLRKKLIQEATANPIKAFLEISAKGAIDNNAAIGIGAGLVSSISKGAQGAANLVSQGLGAFADTLLPGIGGAVSEIVSLLGQGPEKVKETVREFAKALPAVIEAIVTAIPVLIEELVNAVPLVVQKLVEAAPRVIDALIESAPSLITSLVTQLPKIASELAKLMPLVAFQFSAELIKNIPSIVFQIAQGIFNALIQVANSIVNYVVDFLNSLNPFGGDDGGFLGLAEGGRVPDVARYAGDKFPARLDAGEQVLSRDLSSRLEDFLNGGGGGGGQPLQINLQIGLEQFAKVMLEADRLGYRVRV